MGSSNHGGPEDVVSTVVVSESLFARVNVLQQFSTTNGSLTLVRSPGNLDELIACCRHFEHCVLILESASLLNATPMQISELMRRGRSVRVLAQVDKDEIPTLRSFMLMGCFGFLTEDTTLPRLRNVLEAVTRGEMWFPRRLLSQVFQTLLFEQNANCLSRREREILTLLGQELSNKQISEHLFISQETLRWHLRNLYNKTRVQGRDKLIQYANEFNWLAPEDHG
jgi:DNA-binding NarL/FixJ family response regulator